MPLPSPAPALHAAGAEGCLEESWGGSALGKVEHRQDLQKPAAVHSALLWSASPTFPSGVPTAPDMLPWDCPAANVSLSPQNRYPSAAPHTQLLPGPVPRAFFSTCSPPIPLTAKLVLSFLLLFRPLKASLAPPAAVAGGGGDNTVPVA